MSIEFNNVSFTYMRNTPYQRQALHQVNLTINAGEFVAIIGHTGSGKSTLVQHMNGLLTPTSGTVTIDGVNINKKGDIALIKRREVGMVFQYPEHQLFEETVCDDVAFGPKNMGLPQGEINNRVTDALHFVGLNKEEYGFRSPFRLSGGQMRRVAIAGVIALRPEYLILDEPSAGLDPQGRQEIFGQIMNLHKTTGITVILVSHNMEEVARLAGRLIVLDHGQIVLDGQPAEVFQEGLSILKKAGLDVPQSVSLLNELRNRGLDVATNGLTSEEAASAIWDAIRRARKC